MINIQKTSGIADPSKLKYLIYGAPKVGKSTFSSMFPNALFAATEPGHDFLKLDKVDIKDIEDFRAVGRHLIKEKHDYKTLVIDTVDGLYDLACEEVCKINGVKAISDIKWGQGYTDATKNIYKVLSHVHKAGLGLIFITHAEMKEFDILRNVPDGEGGHITTTSTVKHVTTTLTGKFKKLVHAYSDMIFYLYADDDGNRFIKTKPENSVEGGDRSGKLPSIMKLDYEEFKKNMDKIDNTNKKGK